MSRAPVVGMVAVKRAPPRGMLAGWLVLATWTALGVMLATLTRGTALAIGIGTLYALVVEGLVSALVGVIGLLEPVGEIFARANANFAGGSSRRGAG